MEDSAKSQAQMAAWVPNCQRRRKLRKTQLEPWRRLVPVCAEVDAMKPSRTNMPVALAATLATF